MLFNSYIFILLFLPLTIGGYFALQHKGCPRGALAFLTGASLFFYGYNYPPYAILLVLSILVNFVLVRLITPAQGWRRRLFFGAGLLFDLGVLGYYKYYDFFIGNLNDHFSTDFPLIHIMLPLGISFFTFQQLSFLIDAFKGKETGYSFLEYSTFVTFFPQLIAGPIVLHEELIPQLKDPAKRRPDAGNISRGLYGFSMGLAKKVLIADMLGPIVEAHIYNLEDRNLATILTVMLCYTLQLYFDFSGYSDMATGLSRMFNFELPANFLSPFKADSLREHWKRWHITMSRFFTQYVYIPLGGSRKGELRTWFNTIITFTLSGLWHGAAWTFVLWGFLDGLFICVERTLRKAIQGIKTLWHNSSAGSAISPGRAKGICLAYLSPITKVIRTALVFCLTTSLHWLFREHNITEWKATMKAIFQLRPGPLLESVYAPFKDHLEVTLLSRAGLNGLFTEFPALPLYLFLFFCLVLVFFTKNVREKMESFAFRKRELFLTAGLLLWCIVSLSSITEFLYFNF